jgi:tryptophanyl-tRNA synthetase
VPVGEDQKQHLELARDIAQAFNRQFGVEFFPLPEPQIMGPAARVMSLRDGTKKMSKSDESEYSRINMSDSAETIQLKIRKAKTDPLPLPDSVEALATRPEAANLLGIHAALTDRTIEQSVAEFAGTEFSKFKEALSDTLNAALVPIEAERARLMTEPGYVDGILRRGAERAAAIAEPMRREVYDIIGMLRP